MENLNNFILAAINKITYFNFIPNKNLVEALENIMLFLVFDTALFSPSHVRTGFI